MEWEDGKIEVLVEVWKKIVHGHGKEMSDENSKIKREMGCVLFCFI